MSRKIYDMITERILELLNNGVVPWEKPWSCNSAPKNLISKKEYHGINSMLLGHAGYGSPWFLTFKQVKNLGGYVRKGEKGYPVVFWKFLEIMDKESGETETIPLLKYYTVFNVDQCECIPEGKIPVLETREIHSIDECERVVDAMPNRPEIRYSYESRAYYSPLNDYIHIPHRNSFFSSEKFYGTIFHEMCHSTAHVSRLARKNLNEWARFGSSEYSREELVAEMGAGFLCAHCGIENKTIENSAAYIQNWLNALKNDEKAVVIAAGQAQKAVNYITGNSEA